MLSASNIKILRSIDLRPQLEVVDGFTDKFAADYGKLCGVAKQVCRLKGVSHYDIVHDALLLCCGVDYSYELAVKAIKASYRHYLQYSITHYHIDLLEPFGQVVTAIKKAQAEDKMRPCKVCQQEVSINAFARAQHLTYIQTPNVCRECTYKMRRSYFKAVTGRENKRQRKYREQLLDSIIRGKLVSEGYTDAYINSHPEVIEKRRQQILAYRAKHGFVSRPKGRPFSAEDDALIVSDKKPRVIAKLLNRTTAAISSRRYKLLNGKVGT